MNEEIDFGAALQPKPESAAALALEPEVLPAIQTPNGFDIAPVALNLVPYEKHVALLVKQAKGVVVTDSESNKAAVSIESSNKLLYKKLETARKGFVAPYNEHVKKINNIFKTLTDPLLANEALIKKVRGDYDYQLLLERRAEEARLREEQRQLQARLNEEARQQREEADRKAREAAEKLKTEQDAAARAALEKTIEEETAAAEAPAPTVAPIVIEKPKVIRTAEGSSYTTFKWVCRVVDPDLVPRTYCEPFQKHLDDAVKGGIREISGCIIEEVAIPKTRV